MLVSVTSLVHYIARIFSVHRLSYFCIGYLVSTIIVACNLLHEITNTPKGLNKVPYVVWSCNKLHATHEIMNTRNE